MLIDGRCRHYKWLSLMSVQYRHVTSEQVAKLKIVFVPYLHYLLFLFVHDGIKTPSDYNSSRMVLSVMCRMLDVVSNFKHKIISKRFELEG